MAQQWVRVKDKRTGHEYSVVNVNKDIHEVLQNKRAANANGRPFKAKPKVGRASASSDEVDLDSLTVPELQDRAKKAKVEGYTTMNKDDLVKALKGENK